MNGIKRKVHFVGVGGIGMSGLAEILLNLGYEVSGTDLHATTITSRLVQCGLRFFDGHEAGHIGEAEIVVVSEAVPRDNVEVAAARERGTPVLHRSELLADLMRLKPHAIAVGGTHGKTTTTSMISAMFERANFGATSIVGGILHRSGTNARWGTGEYLVAEADEHDGSFLRLHPTMSVVTSIDAEHLEYYGTLDRIKHAFADFCNVVPFYGYSIVCWDDPNVRSILEEIESVCLTFGTGEGASLQGVNIRHAADGEALPMAARLAGIRTSIDVMSHDDRLGVVGDLGTLEVKAVGIHNVRNALAACCVGLCLGLRFPHIADGLRMYDGVRRRLQVRGEERGVLVVEDYAHHPTEIESTFEAIRWINPKRIIAIFQPHLFSRTKFFCEQFARVLSTADRAIVTEIYPSREDPMPGVDSGLIVDAAHALGAQHVQLIDDMFEVPARVAREVAPGDVVLVLGAGDINVIAEPLLQELAKQL